MQYLKNVQWHEKRQEQAEETSANAAQEDLKGLFYRFIFYLYVCGSSLGCVVRVVRLRIVRSVCVLCLVACLKMRWCLCVYRRHKDCSLTLVDAVRVNTASPEAYARVCPVSVPGISAVADEHNLRCAMQFSPTTCVFQPHTLTDSVTPYTHIS
jgi:hypothetical protein